MKKLKKNNKTNPDAYEDFVRSENLDPYESLIKSYEILKQNKKYVE